MPIDILDQPRGGILETAILYLYRKGSSCLLNQIINDMTGSKEGEDYFKRNVIDLLEAIGFINIQNGQIKLKDCPILERWIKNGGMFDTYFKIELLSKTVKSENPYIGYFADMLRKLFDQETFESSTLETIMRETRRNRGIPVSEGEELGGKITFCITFLKFFNMIQQIKSNYIIFVPQKLLQTIISISLEEINKPSVKLYSELFEHIDNNYLPVLNRQENRLLFAIHKTLSREEFLELFNFANVPDGGRPLYLNNKEFNAILLR